MWDALCILENTKRTHTFYWVNNILYLYIFCICDTEHRIGQNHHRISWNGVMTDLCIKDNFFKTKTFTHIYIHWFNVTSLSVCLSATDVSLMTNNRLKSRLAAHSTVNYSLRMSEQQSDVVVFLFETWRTVTGDGPPSAQLNHQHLSHLSLVRV